MVAAMTIVSCANNSGTNPFLTEWDTPYGIPPFEQIGIDDYMPAINAGIEQQNAAIATITSNAEEPTFDNTIAPLELSSGILDKVSGVLYNISETDRTDELDSIVELAIPVMTEHSDNISFNQALFQRIAKLYEGDQSSLTREQQMVLKKYYEQFQRSGSGLPQDKQDQLRKINTEMASKQQKIGNNILAESNAFKAKFGISVSEFPNAMTSTETATSVRRCTPCTRCADTMATKTTTGSSSWMLFVFVSRKPRFSAIKIRRSIIWRIRWRTTRRP